jgi:hypothetical protein
MFLGGQKRNQLAINKPYSRSANRNLSIKNVGVWVFRSAPDSSGYLTKEYDSFLIQVPTDPGVNTDKRRTARRVSDATALRRGDSRSPLQKAPGTL